MRRRERARVSGHRRSPAAQPSLDQFIDHIAYIANLVGIDHVGLGIDYSDVQYPFCTTSYAGKIYAELLADGTWTEEACPRPPSPKGLETPEEYPNLTRRLLQRGFIQADVAKVLEGGCRYIARSRDKLDRVICLKKPTSGFRDGAA